VNGDPPALELELKIHPVGGVDVDLASTEAEGGVHLVGSEDFGRAVGPRAVVDEVDRSGDAKGDHRAPRPEMTTLASATSP